MVEKLGDNVSGFSKGQRVVGIGHNAGTWSQFITAPASKLVRHTQPCASVVDFVLNHHVLSYVIPKVLLRYMVVERHRVLAWAETSAGLRQR